MTSQDEDKKNAMKCSDIGEEQPLERPRSASKTIVRVSKTDEESYSACQELAYQYAVEQTKSAVRTVLLKANTNCYHQVLRYFEKYMSVKSSTATTPLAATSASTATLSQKKNLLDELVAFPEFHGFPTAAIVAGTDATFSEVWVNPLCQVLKRSFPLVFVVREDFQNARRIVEWMAEQLDVVKRVRESEERWLLDQIDGFDMLDTAAETAEKAEAYLTGRRATLRDRSTLTKSLRGTYEIGDGGGDASSKQRRGAGDDDDDKDDEFVALEDEDDSDEYEGSDGGWKRKKRKRRSGAASSTATTTAAAGVSSAYSKWTMAQLLVRIQTDLELLMGSDDPFKMWIPTLHDLIDDKLDTALQNHEGDLERSLQCYSDTIDWLKKRISACRSLPGSSGSTANQSGVTASVNVCSAEFSLAQILHEVMTKFVAFLEAAGKATEGKYTAPPHRGAGDLHEARVKRERELVDRWRRRVSGFLKLHEDYYQLHHFNAKQYEDDPRKPFFLICIEQLEAFNQQVLDDFLVLWTNFSRQSVLEQRHHQPYGAGSDDIGSRMGFIVGVASSASPALRHLNLSIVSQIDMQFFSLEDSRKCFDDILEALIVDTNLPLCLSGDVMRWVAGRHRTTQSITMFLHALEFLFFTHFKSVPWSFLSHFCLEAHWGKPLQSVMAPSRRLAQWVRHANLQTSITMHDYLMLFSDPILDELRELVFPVVKPERDWLEVLLDEVSWLRQQRANWAVGWKCFRAACSWLDIELQGDEFTSYLAAALDGKLANTGKVCMIVQKLGSCTFRIASFLLEDWKAICQASVDARKKVSSDDDTNPLTSVITLLSELVLLCQFAMETHKQPTTQKMLPKLHQELKNAFSDSIIVALVQPPRARLHNSSSSQQVRQWLTVTDVQTLEDRLHFNYYDRLKDLLLEIEEGENGGGHAGGTSWVNDVSLAFLYYQESAGIYLSISEWYETFADALEDEFAASSNGKNKKKATKLTKDEQEAVDVETKARFLRAFCTLRHWGFVKSSSSDSDTIEKVVFI